MRQSRTTRYEDVLFGGFTMAGTRHDLIVLDVKRRTDAVYKLFGARLWAMAGGNPDRLDQVGDAEVIRFARTRCGRYPWVEVTVYDDDTYSYRTPTSGGGDFDLANILVIDRDRDIHIVPSPLDAREA